MNNANNHQPQPPTLNLCRALPPVAPEEETVETVRLCGLEFQFVVIKPAAPHPIGEIRVMAEGKCVGKIVNI